MQPHQYMMKRAQSIEEVCDEKTPLSVKQLSAGLSDENEDDEYDKYLDQIEKAAQ